MKKPSISIVIPAYNEAGNLSDAVNSVILAFDEEGITDREIIIIDDVSTDGTGKIADKLSAANNFVKAIHNDKNRGIGGNFQIGWWVARSEYTGLVPGDNEMTHEAVRAMIAAVGKSDIVNTYISNPGVRPLARRVLSTSFTGCMNILFGTQIPYLTGPGVIRTQALREVAHTNSAFAWMMEILVLMVRAGYSIVSVPMPLQPRKYGGTSVFKMKNVWRVLKGIVSVFRRVYLTDAVKKLSASRVGSQTQ